MKRTVYGTWTQIHHVIKQNNKLNKQYPGVGYDHYEITQIDKHSLPPASTNEGQRFHQYDGDRYNFVNYDAMFSPNCNAVQDALRTNTPVEYFRITLCKQ